MTVLTDQVVGFTEEERVDGWRRERFEQLLPDFSERTIDKLVINHSISPNDFERLFKAGCDAKTATRILI